MVTMAIVVTNGHDGHGQWRPLVESIVPRTGAHGRTRTRPHAHTATRAHGQTRTRPDAHTATRAHDPSYVTQIT